jgi:ABC-type xylose transport system permease subunit
MIVLGVILLLLGWLVPGIPAFVSTLGWILIVVGLILLVLGQVGRPVGRRHWY